jgi:ABC-type transport system involved in multi-copper enzyme maturation permease subunit
MNTAVLIASRELRDRTHLFLIAAAMAVVPFGAALAVRENRALAIATVACFLAAAYTQALAVALGVSSIGRELTEKRLSFLYAKPVSAASIWIGKATAGILTWLSAFAIIVLPTYVFAHDGWRDNWAAGGDAITAYTLIFGTVLFFGSHAASTMLRSRSALVAVDFVLLSVMLVAILTMTRPILLGGGLDVVLMMLSLIGAALLAILAVAPIWQLARGRTEPRRNHAAFSTALWSGAAVVVTIAAGYAYWVISAPLASITNLYNVEQSPTGQWLSVSGLTANRGSYQASFIVDSTNGKRERVSVSPWSTAHVSRDGNTVVWMESDELVPRSGTLRLHTLRLEAGATQTATPLVISLPRHAQITDDGSRLAIITGDKITVYEVGTGRLLGAAQGINQNDVRSIFFAGPNVVRMFETSRGGAAPVMRIREFDVSRGKLTATAERAAPRSPAIQVSRDGSRLYVRQDATILDAQTGNVLMTLPVKPAKPYFGTMLSDGSTIVTRDSKLYHFDPNGVLAAEVPIPVQQAGVVGQVGQSKVLLSIGGNNPSDWRMLIVDLAARKVDVAMPGLRSPLSWWADPAVPQFTEDATIVAMDEQRKLLLVDARTGAKRPFPS